MKVDASRIQPPVTEHTQYNAPAKIRQPEPKDPAKHVEKSATGSETVPQQNRAQGAMRLLQEGHFKGVAALRLRINFFDQLPALEQESIQAIAQEGIAELTLVMQEQVDDLNNGGLIGEESLPQLAELADTFISEMQSSVAGETLDQQQLITTLELHYGNFRTALQNLLQPPEPTPTQATEPAQQPAIAGIFTEADQGVENSPLAISPLEGELPAGQAAVSPSNPAEESGSHAQLAASLDVLDSTFRNQLSGIEERLQDSSLLSVPEQPNNNGAAFQKFVTTYREMQGMAEVSNEQAETKGS